jgi:hypothetical protein
MSRSNGTYTAPTSGWKPALEGSVIDSSDWNTLLDDVEAAVTETVYTGGLGATDNAMARTDGTDTKKAQGSTPTISDTGVIAGVATFLLTSYTIGTLPVGTEGQIAYASDWDVNGGASSGSLVFFDGEAWRGVDTGTTTSGVSPPYNTVAPVISGTLTEDETLTTTDGTWLQSPTSYTYQWKRDGVNIGGATSNNYVLLLADVGSTITVTVTATNAAGSTNATSAGVGPVSAGFGAVLVKKAADQTGADYAAATAVTWDTETFDVTGWHDTGSNTSRLTVPSGVSYVRLSASVNLSGVTTLSRVYAYFTKNGGAQGSVPGLPTTMQYSSATTPNLNLVSAPLAVSPCDYFECVLLGTASLTVEDHSWFAMERVG